MFLNTKEVQMMTAIEVRIDKWKKRLLDLGKRNRMINYKETKRSNIKIVSPDFADLYEQLVVQEKALEFPFPYDEDEDDLEEVEYQLLSISDIQTDRTIREQQKTLRNLRNKAKTSIEEQGVNTLYLSFGFLKWNESPDLNQTIKSPLILVPVSLTLESINSPFVLRLHEDEIVINPTLKHKLHNDFGIILPEYDGLDDGVLQYLKGLNENMKSNKWEVIYETGLSLFSFLKINMYEDLDQNTEIVSSHPVIKALSGDRSQITTLSDEYNEYDHDNKTRPIDTYQIVDADSSQQDAILYAKKGVSFVLQGPPGTGKSQTITNIIAECLADGKKVLFVSEKMAALEVVYKRLSQSEISDFCLTLHNHKAKKKEVLEELGSTLNTNRLKLQDEALYKLELLKNQRDKLNQYIKELHTPIHPLNQSLYEVNGKLAKYYQSPDVIFSIGDVKGTTPEKLNKYTYLLNELSKTIGKMSEDYASNPWRGCHVSTVSHELRHDIETNLRNLIPKIKTLAETFNEVKRDLKIEWKSSVATVKEMIDILELSSESPGIPIHWIGEEDFSPLIEQAEKYKSMKADYESLVEELFGKYEEAYFVLSAEEIKEELQTATNNIKPVLNSENFKDNQEIVCKANKTITELEDVVEKVSSAYRAGITISERFNIPQKSTISELTVLYEMLWSILLDPKPTEAWFEGNKFAAIKKLSVEAKEKHDQINEAIQSITSRYDKEILQLDYSAMLKRFRVNYTSWIKIFKRNYRNDKKEILALANDPPKKLKDEMIVALLNELKELGDKKAWLEEKKDLLNEYLESHYQYDLTDWDLLKKAFNYFENIQHFFSGEPIPYNVKQFLLDGGDDHQEIKKLCDKIGIVKDSGLLATFEHVFSLSSNIEDIDITELGLIIQDTLELFKTIDRLYIDITKYSQQDITFEKAMDNLDKLNILQLVERSINNESESLKENYQYLFNGIETDWANILDSLSWSSQFKKMIATHDLADSFIEGICSDTNFTKKVAEDLKLIKENNNRITEEWNWYLGLFDNKSELEHKELNLLSTKMEQCLNNISSLEEWIDFRSSREACRKEGLTEYVEKIEALKINKELIASTFLKRFYRLWVDAVIPDFPAVDSFRSRNHEDVINEFHKLDVTQMSIARSRIKEHLASRLPNLNVATTAVDEVGILRRELGKQRKIMPLRKLFRAIPNLLLTLKPCLMMSPLSVSLFLQADRYKFDVVIFDEASQVCTEDAVGAIMRGAQVIIAGDSKQLPPTSFFAANTSDGDFDTDEEDEDKFDDADAFESILDESVTVLPERTLRWHYRSRHEHLIAFSNAKIYNHDLVTFPSHIDNVPDNGVEYFHVSDGVYDRGGKKNNINEAKRVAELVFEHFKNQPYRSLGVVTFSEAQQQAVETAIRQLRLQHQRFEGFFNEDKEEAFFIKNLENVQGDERDTIIFSIGYAKDPNGVMYMNFGPLSRSGGHRRLNVAITRAKYNVKLVGSIHPTDIKLENTNSEGVKLLRSYIEFAINGAEVLQRELSYSDTVQVDSPFEESVYDFLVKNRFKVVTQVGCSGYRIDLAVKHPTLDGRFVIGIECDGATYHSTRTARERDRLRQTVLEDIGWKIYRIWSTDWVKDPITEGQKLIDAVNKAISEYQEDGIPTENDQEIVEKLPSSDNFLTVEVSAATLNHDEDTSNNPYMFDYYEEADVYEVERHTNDVTYLANVIKYVVEKENPIHFELLCKRIAGLFGNQKVTVKVRNSADFVIKNYLAGDIERKGDFCWIKDTEDITVRIPPSEDVGVRPIHQISVEEVAEAMFQIASKSIGIETNELYVVTARIFGFNRMGDKISKAMQKACQLLVETGRVKISSEKIIV
jgi:very-short-patch-repair endonuclease